LFFTVKISFHYENWDSKCLLFLNVLIVLQREADFIFEDYISDADIEFSKVQ
jgi:hypothetical protein